MQTNSDNILEELSVMFGCTRQSLMVTASEKGVVVGRIQVVNKYIRIYIYMYTYIYVDVYISI